VVARVTTVEWQIVVVVRLSLENAATALMRVPSNVAIGKIVQTVRRPDITAIKAAFISTCVFGAGAIGGAARRPSVNSVRFWMVGVQVCFAIGLLIGQLLALPNI
jgi:hypothetical protein